MPHCMPPRDDSGGGEATAGERDVVTFSFSIHLPTQQNCRSEIGSFAVSLRRSESNSTILNNKWTILLQGTGIEIQGNCTLGMIILMLGVVK
jgi:hypothetical protein